MIDLLLEMITKQPLATAISFWLAIILAYDYIQKAIEEELMKSSYINNANNLTDDPKDREDLE